MAFRQPFNHAVQTFAAIAPHLAQAPSLATVELAHTFWQYAPARVQPQPSITIGAAQIEANLYLPRNRS
ncbi:hypothetical protein [Shewanella sp.]|uniref:hypothetical protein n=1 Tax=Shewanella sp. TaxID=50422 RepID=UPI003A97305E